MDIANLSEIVQAKEALYAYLALPDAAAIASRMHPANSASEAVKLILDAKNEAWRIRLEMAEDWDEATMARVDSMLDTELGKVPYEQRKLHPITGPLMSARFPDGAFVKMRNKALQELLKEREEEEANRKEAAKITGKPARSKGGTNATKNREGALMVRCVKRYVELAETEKKSICLKSAREFQTTERIKKERLTEFLCTLVSGLNNSLSDEVILGILNDCKTMRRKRPKGKTWGEAEPEEVPEKHFENVELPAVSECMKTLRDAVQKKHGWTKLD
ncbi:MAG: hypothetical protein WAW39_19090 [Prosthecobacter sp.]|uniref:hypothetical protein n=1 Tax=Prosthecobacter sp. TaxID=1965333 RepID=UPI003BB13D45